MTGNINQQQQNWSILFPLNVVIKMVQPLREDVPSHPGLLVVIIVDIAAGHEIPETAWLCRFSND